MDKTCKVLLVLAALLFMAREARDLIAPAEAQSGVCGYQKSRPCYYQIVTGY